MTDAAKRIGPTAITGTSAGAAQSLYTAPANGTVLRYIKAVNTSGAERRLFMSIGAAGAGTAINYDVPVYVSDKGEEQGVFIPMTSGEILRVWADAVGLTLTVGHIEQ